MIDFSDAQTNICLNIRKVNKFVVSYVSESSGVYRKKNIQKNSKEQLTIVNIAFCFINTITKQLGSP